MNIHQDQIIQLKNKTDINEFDTLRFFWAVREHSKSLFDLYFGGNGRQLKIDIVTLLLNKYGRIENIGKSQSGTNNIAFAGGDIIYFNVPEHPSGAVVLNTTQAKQTAIINKTELFINYSKLNERYCKIAVVLSIHGGQGLGQHFGQLNDFRLSYCEANTKKEHLFQFADENRLHGMCSSVLLEIYRADNDWRLQIKTEFNTTDNFVELLKRYL